ncbi:MAG: PfkB family carbohydrate kinase [Nocardioides sp.]|uniref:PfkB family carbohydrate kinase n=1 Tax=Nocardioides sp. TaxID=35761 RepID=UPI0039E2142D
MTAESGLGAVEWGLGTVESGLGSAVLVVGGANVDLKARSAAPLVPETSNPGSTVLSPGGVGRNIAEVAARLGARVSLVSIVGADALGDDLLGTTAEAGVDIALVQRTATATGTYTALLDATGDLVAAVADMAAIEQLDPAPVAAVIAHAEPGTIVVLDGNLLPDALAHLLAAAGSGLRVVLDPVSVPKAVRLLPALAGPPTAGEPVRDASPGSVSPAVARSAGPAWAGLFLLTPNRDELAALTGLAVDTDDALIAAAESLRERGITWVWVRLGAAGSVMVGPDGATVLPAYSVDVVDVTGAGDAMLGAFCQALASGASVEEAARIGQAAAALTVASPDTVRTDLTPALISTLMKETTDAAAH